MCSSRKAAFLLFAVLAYLYFRGIGDHGLLDPLEGINASVALNMTLERNFTAPRIEGLPYWGTTMGFWWLEALAFSFFGEFEFATRFWSALAGLGMATVSWFIARRHGELAANYAAVITGTSLLAYTVSQLASFHALYACLVNAALLGAVYASSNRRFFSLLHVSAALAMIVRGPSGLILPWLSFLLYAYLTGEERFFLKGLFHWPGLLATIFLGGGYLFFLRFSNPEVLTLMRYNPPSPAFASFSSALTFLAVGYFPWVGAFPEAIKNALPANRHFISNSKKQSLLLLTWVATFLIFGLFSRDALLLAALPPALAALCASRLAAGVEKNDARLFRRLVVLKISIFALLFFIGLPCIHAYSAGTLRITLMSVIPWGFFCCLFLLAGWYYAKKRQPRKLMLHLCLTSLLSLLPLAGVFDLLARDLSVQDAGFYLRRTAERGDIVAQYFMNHPSLYFYTGRRSLLIQSPITPGVRGQEILTEDALHRRWEEASRVFLVMKRQKSLRPLPSGLEVYNIHAGEHLILSNFAEARPSWASP